MKCLKNWFPFAQGTFVKTCNCDTEQVGTLNKSNKCVYIILEVLLSEAIYYCRLKVHRFVVREIN